MNLKVLGLLFVTAVFGAGSLFPVTACANSLAPNLKTKPGVQSKIELGPARTVNKTAETPGSVVPPAATDQSNSSARSIKELSNQVEALRTEVQQLKQSKQNPGGLLHFPSGR
jgi:hypothetical protein